MENQGWIKLHRKILDSTPLFGKSHDFAIFVYLLLKADRLTGNVKIGRIRLSKLFRIPESTLYDVLNRLRIRGYVDIKTNNQYSDIHICNFGKYQSQTNTESVDDPSRIREQTNTIQEVRSKNLLRKKNNEEDTMKFGAEAILERERVREAKKARKGRGLQKTYEEVYPKRVPAIKPISLHPTTDSISQEEILATAKKYKITEAEVVNKLEDLRLYTLSTGKTYDDYLAGLEFFITNAIKREEISPIKSKLETMFEEGISVPINGKWIDNMEDYKKEYAIWEANNENN